MPETTDASPRRTHIVARDSGAESGRSGRKAPWRLVLAWVIALSFAVLFAIGWELAARYEWVDPFFVSRPSAIVYQLVDWWHGGTSRGPLPVHIRLTLGEAALGLVAGSIAGALCGAAFRAGTLAGDAFRLILGIFRPAPLVALAVAIVLGVGSGLGSPVAASSAFAAAIVFCVAAGDAQAHRPAMTTLRRRCGLALAGAVLAECFAARSGVGFLIARALHQFNAGGLYAAFVLLAAVALCVDALAAAAERWWLRARVQALPAARR
jgi:NitT/TauT family transport system permease protein